MVALTYTYDNANRLIQIAQGSNLVAIGYDDADRRTSLALPNGNSVVYTYNAASELISLTYKQGATVIGDLTYIYDAAGNRIKTGGAFARTTIPPALATASYNANNQQTTFGPNSLTYDFNGNLQTVTDAGGTATYSWNARNQLAAITAPGFAASFSYDSFGRRTGKTVQGATTNFVYDGLNPVQEKAGVTVTANLLTGLGIDEFLTRTDGVGTSALLPDALGSTVALGDGTGTIQTQYTYEPFGYASQTGSANTSSYKYTGREDDGTGLYYYRARYYHPRLQRFISEDPIGFVSRDVNIYEYVNESPLTFIDPTGEFGIIGGTIGAGVEVGIQAFKNYESGCDVFNASNYDWWDVAWSGAVGAASAGWFDVGKTAWKSGGAIGNLSGQLDRARTAGKAAKIQGRIQSHQSQIADAFIVQGAWQGVKELLKQLNGSNGCSCN